MAFCGVLSALAVALLLAGGIIPLATYCCPILAMLALLPVLEEFGPRLALISYAAVSVLGLLLAPDKEVACFFLFLGYYPILRPQLDRLRSRLVRTLLKLVLFNVSILALYLLLLFVFQLSAILEDFAGLSLLMGGAMLLIGNCTFLVLDGLLSRLTLVYRYRLRKKWFKRS